MLAFSLGSIDSLVTKWNKGVWSERVVETETSRSCLNGRDEPKEAGQEHSVRHSRCALHGNVGHPFCHVVGKVEGLPS